MTIQSRIRKPSRAFVIDTKDVLTIVVSIVERNKATHRLFRSTVRWQYWLEDT